MGRHDAPDRLIGEHWSRAAILTVLLCGLAGSIDSFDTQMIGFTGRLIAQDLRFPVAQLGWLFGAGQLGGVVGAVLFGMLADRFGRARMLVVTCLSAAAFTAASLTATTLPGMLVFRMLTGIGLGGVLPCFLSLGVEAMPPRLRVAMTPILYASFPLGGAAGAWISAPLIAAYGWRGVFAFGAGSLAAVGVLALVSPLVGEGPRSQARAGRVSALLAPGLVRVTLPLWVVFLLAPPGVYLLVLWMPPILQILGVSAARTSILVGFLNVGALGVAIVGGWVMARLGHWRTLAPALLVGAIGFAAIAAAHRDFPALIAVTIVTGAALGGAMPLLVSIAAIAYPAEVRATGIGWALGVARIGQMTAPIPIGWLLGAGVAPQVALIACGGPPLLALIPLFLLDRALKKVRPV